MSYTVYTIQGVVTNGTIISDNMSIAYERCYISVVFYSDNFITPVTPSAGTLTFEASETGERYGSISDGVITASIEKYNRPNFSGSAKNVRSVALGILGAVNYRATIDRFEG